jgi:hypothetical protein
VEGFLILLAILLIVGPILGIIAFVATRRLTRESTAQVEQLAELTRRIYNVERAVEKLAGTIATQGAAPAQPTPQKEAEPAKPAPAAPPARPVPPPAEPVMPKSVMPGEILRRACWCWGSRTS